MDNPEEIDLDLDDDDAMDEDAVPDDEPQSAPEHSAPDDGLFTPVEISTYLTVDAATAARVAAGVPGDGRSSGGVAREKREAFVKDDTVLHRRRPSWTALDTHY